MTPPSKLRVVEERTSKTIGDGVDRARATSRHYWTNVSSRLLDSVAYLRAPTAEARSPDLLPTPRVDLGRRNDASTEARR
jgi:hypothetical protein